MLVLGNWKLHGSLALLDQFVPAFQAATTASVQCGLCLPAAYLLPFAAKVSELKHIAVAAQDVSQHEKGAYTGEVSAAMLRDCGASYVLVGHSERRQYHAETDALVGRKAQIARENGLVPVICVGETLADRQAARQNEVVLQQLHQALAQTDIAKADELVIAYEPVWAIGTGEVASPQQAQDMHACIRESLLTRFAEDSKKIKLLYGGSVNPDNAASLFAQTDIDGGLVGGASLKPADFAAICAAAASA